MNTCSRNLFRLILISFTLLNSFVAIAQCAGTGQEITICDKELNIALQAYNLFDVLTGETTGGTWIAETNFDSAALNETTGILNLWRINRFGAHAFTYMNPGCDNSTATVILNLGGYPGETNQNAGTNNVCQVLKDDDDDNSNIIDLFIFVDTVNGIIGPDTGGMWTEDPGNLVLGALNNEFFDFENVPIGTYTFTYTVPVIDVCSERSATIDVEVRRTPNAGSPLDLNLCETDDMSGLTTLNLFSRLVGEDSNGEWTDRNGTGEITNGTDFEIDVQNIYNNFGPGNYSFGYRVLPDHPICEEKESIFTVCIEEQNVLQGTVSVSCNGSVVLSYNNGLLNNGLYNLSYTITGTGLGTFSNTEGSLSFQNGIAQFNLFPDLQLVDSEELTIQIDNIVGFDVCGPTALCTSIVSVPPENFDMYIEASISVSSASACQLDDVVINYMNATDVSFAPINGTLPVTYSINAVNYTDDVVFVNGNATSSISVDRFVSGTNQLVFFETNSFVHCGNINRTSNINLIPAPPNPIFSIVPDNRCDATSLQFGFDSPSGEFISYSAVTFDIYQFGSEPQQFDPRDASVSLTNNTQGDGIDINIINTNDVNALPDGDYVFVIRSVQNDNAPCRGLSQIELDNYAAQGIDIGLTQIGVEHIFDARLTFKIGTQEPVALINNAFEVCLINGDVTLGDIPISAGSGFDTVVRTLDGTALFDTYKITKNEVFIVDIKSDITGCDAGQEQITITVVGEASKPILNNNVFCAIGVNTVEDLDRSGQNIVWYDSETNGLTYPSLSQIDINKAYWAEATISGGCISKSRTLANIRLVDKAGNPIPLINEFCSAASPTISDLIVEKEDDSVLQWYTSETGIAYTATSLPLDATQQYWVSQSAADGCESDRVQVAYTLTNVAPDPVPLGNVFCEGSGMVYTLDDLSYEITSISREGVISYFSDPAGTIPILSTELLDNITSPVYVQQIIAGTCISDIVGVNFIFQGLESKPTFKNSFEVCLLNGPVQLSDLGISAGQGFDIVVTDLLGAALLDTYEITQDDMFIAVIKNAVTGCDLGTEQIIVEVVTAVASPILNTNVFCATVNSTVADLNVSGQDIIWYDAEVDGVVYNTSDSIDINKTYWAEAIIAGDCISNNRTQAVISIINKANAPIPLTNEFCISTNPTINDLIIESDASATLQWYTSATGPLYPSTSILLDATNQYWVSQTLLGACESDRVQVLYTTTNIAINPMPLENNFCTAGGMVFTLENLSYNDVSIIDAGVLSYFSDAAGTVAISSTELLENVVSPTYVQQIVAGTCASEIIEVDFRLQGIASKPVLPDVKLCLESNPTIQDLINLLQNETSSEIILYENETTTVRIDVNLELASISGELYASQIIIDGCESIERELVNLTLENPTLIRSDFKQLHCRIEAPILGDVYLGNENIVWLDENNNPLLASEVIQDGVSYFAQLEIETCLSPVFEVVITLVDVENPIASSNEAGFCGINEKVIADLLEDDTGNIRFTTPLNHSLVWYDSNDVSTRNLLENDAVLEQGMIYYAVYEFDTTIDGERVLCESTSLGITVDLTICTPEELIIPDAFSPNSDNINDTFELQNIEFVYPDYAIEIYNRYGRVVFKGNTTIGFWDGKSNQSGLFSSDILPTGVYFYVINFNRFDKKPYQGQVYLKR